MALVYLTEKFLDPKQLLGKFVILEIFKIKRSLIGSYGTNKEKLSQNEASIVDTIFCGNATCDSILALKQCHYSYSRKKLSCVPSSVYEFQM